MLNKTKKSNRVTYIIIFTSISLGVCLLVYLAVGRPVLKYSDSLKAEFARKQAKLLESQELVRSVPNTLKAIDEIKVKLQEFQDLGVSKKQIPRLMQILGQTASERSITVISLRPREDVKSEEAAMPSGINRIYLEIVITCNYQALADYIKAVNELPNAFRVESLTIEKESDTLAPADAKSGAKAPAASTGLLKAVLVLSTISG
jgi:Tfp pilus assembly protein PilO